MLRIYLYSQCRCYFIIIYTIMSLLSIALELCKEIGWKTYIVWWAVRDMIMNKVPKDIDIATNVSIEDICSRFKTHDIWKNKDFWIVVVQYKWVQFEVAHFRKDWKYSDARRPDNVELVDNIEDDLSRRDFTINAMAYDWENIIDPFDWQWDIQRWIIRFVWNPIDRINEDYLRVIRWFRFAARFKFKFIDEKFISKSAFDLDKISAERITDELIKTASYWWKAMAHFIDRLNKNKIYIIPAIQLCELPQWDYHHPEWNVYQHILHCLCECDIQDYLTVLCVLFHDVGKLYTQWTNKEGNPTYYWHDDVWADWILNTDMKYIKLSKENLKCIAFVCKWHMKWWWVSKKSHIANMVLSPYYNYLTYTTKCDEMWRLYASNFGKWYKRDCQLAEILELYKDKKTFDSSIKTLVDWKKIMALLPWITWKDIWVIKSKTIEYITENNFLVSQEDVNLFITSYNKPWECTS